MCVLLAVWSVSLSWQGYQMFECTLQTVVQKNFADICVLLLLAINGLTTNNSQTNYTVNGFIFSNFI